MARGRASEKSADGRTSNGSTSVAVLAKAVALLDRIAEEAEVTPARLAELTGEPRSTIYRLLASLQELDLVEPGRRRGTTCSASSSSGWDAPSSRASTSARPRCR